MRVLTRRQDSFNSGVRSYSALIVAPILTDPSGLPSDNRKVQAKSGSCSISCVRTQYGRTKLSPRCFANRLIYLQLRTQLGKEKRPPEPIPATFVLSGSPSRTRTYKPSVNTLGQQASVQTLMLMVVGLRFVPARHTRDQRISGGWPSATFVFY